MYRTLYDYLQYIQHDCWNILTLIYRINWQHRLLRQNKLDEASWREFAALDVDLFHIEIRSIFDYIAKSIKVVSEKPQQVRGESFEELYNWLNKKPEANIPKLGKDLASLVQSCQWFKTLRAVRDSTVHFGGFTFVLFREGRILFQVHQAHPTKGLDRKIAIPEVMLSKYHADFELYAGLYLGYLIAYLENFSESIEHRLSLHKIESTPRSYHGGLTVASKWIKKALSL